MCLDVDPRSSAAAVATRSECSHGPDQSIAERLHQHVQKMYQLYLSQPAVFRAQYACNTELAVRLAKQARFDSYALKRNEHPCALHYAAGCGCLEGCQALLHFCPRLHCCSDAAGRTPLCWAAEAGLCATVQLLLQSGADATHSDKDGFSPLHRVVAAGFVRTCHALLDTMAVQDRGLQLQTSLGLTPLHVAAQHGHLEMCKLLVESGLEQTLSTTALHRCPLHLAAIAGHADVVKLLVAVRPETQDFRDGAGMTALEHANERHWPQVVNVLQDALHSQERVRSRWSTAFEPPCRNLLNVCSEDVFLEIGSVHVVQIQHTKLRVSVRVIDVMRSIQAFTLEVQGRDVMGQPTTASMTFARSKAQLPIDDVELLVPRRSKNIVLWRPGSVCRLRVIGTIAANAAAQLGLPSASVTSPWSAAVRVPG